VEFGREEYRTIKFRPWVIAYTEEFQNEIRSLKKRKSDDSRKRQAFVWGIIREKIGSLDG